MKAKVLIAAALPILALAGVAWYAARPPQRLPADSNQAPASLRHGANGGETPQPVLLVAPPSQVRSLVLNKSGSTLSLARLKEPDPLLGPWMAELNTRAAPILKWPASSVAAESTLRTLSQVVGTPASQSSPSPPAGSMITTDATGTSRRIGLYPPGLGGIPIAHADEHSFHLTTDPTSIFDDSAWSGLINPLLAPGFGRDIHIIRVQDADRELILERRYRAWQIQLGKIGGLRTPPYSGDINACEALAKVLGELAFKRIDLPTSAAATGHASGQAATITLYRRAAGTLHSEASDSSDAPTFHTATMTLRGTLGVLGSSLSGESRLTVQTANAERREYGPLAGQLDPAILQQVSTELWQFVSRQAIDVPAADVMKVAVDKTVYARRLTRWDVARAASAGAAASDPKAESSVDADVRKFLFALEHARAETVSAAWSETPADAVMVHIYSPLRKEPVQLQMWIRPGQAMIADGARGLVYTDPSAVLALSLLMPR